MQVPKFPLFTYMKKSIAFIDCFIQTPVNHCVNDFILRSNQLGEFNLASTYHMPAQYGMDSLNAIKKVDAIVVLGSASHVSEKLDWHQRLLDYIIPQLETGTPVLGICFGHQLLAHHYGCKVDYVKPDKEILTQTRNIQILADAMSLKAGTSLELAFAHAQVVTTLSSELKSFAASSLSSNEALIHKKYPLWSFQAHPEASHKFIREDANITDPDKVQKVLNDGYSVLAAFINQC